MSGSHKNGSETRTIKVSDPTPALSAMSIQYDGSRQPGTTYQQPLASPSKPAHGYQQSYNKPYTSALSSNLPEPIGNPHPQLGLKELRGLQTVADGSFTRPNSNLERRPSAVQSKLSSRNRRPSTATSASRPPLPHASTSQASSSYRPHTADTPSYHSRPTYSRAHGSASSESSYAASETSDVLYNSSNGRTSSGGTSATTPGGSDREKERSLSIKPIVPILRPAPVPVIERIPVPSPIHEERRPVAQRPVSDISMSTATVSERSAFSPAISQTSSMARKTSSRYTLSDFNFIRTLGTGSFGRVHLVRSCHNTRFYAIKVLNKERVVRMKQVEHTNSEREMLERVRHPFLVNLWGTFKDAKNLYMVMDFVSGGELFSLLRKSQVGISLCLYSGLSLTQHPLVALSRSCCQVLRCRGSSCPRLPPLARYYLSGSQTREHPSGSRWARQSHRLWLCQICTGYHLDALWYPRLPCTRSRAVKGLQQECRLVRAGRPHL